MRKNLKHKKGVFHIDKTEFLREQLDLLKRKQTDETIEWQDIADFRSDYVGSLEHRDTCRKGAKLLYEYMEAGWVNEPTSTIPKINVDFGSPNEKITAHKERIKAQTERLETNRWIRELSRDELITQYIVDAIGNLQPLEVPKPLQFAENDKAYSLCYSDPHYGVEFSIKGLFGEVINEYSPEIFEQRMWDLFYKIKEIIEKEGITTLHIYDFGDSIDGLIRVSQLWKLRYGVVDSTIKYAEFISNWLNEFTKIVNVKFQMVIDANHSQLRMLGQPKNTFKDDNMSKVIKWFIKERLEKNPNFEFIDNPTGMIFDNLVGFNFLGIHGEVKNMDNALKEFSMIYKVQLNYFAAGHLHHSKYEEIGQDVEVLNIPSIIGIDDYSLSLLKASNAGAKLFCFEENKGKSLEYSIKLQ